MNKKLDHYLIWLIFIALIFDFMWVESAQAKNARTVRLDDKTVAQIIVGRGKTTVLSFPTKPTKVILGNQSAFKVQYVENDLAISSESGQGKSNLFVYIPGRRFAFDLIVQQIGDEIVLVRDLAERPFRQDRGK